MHSRYVSPDVIIFFIGAFAQHGADGLVDSLTDEASTQVVSSCLDVVYVEVPVGVELPYDAFNKFRGVVGSQCDGNATLKYESVEKAFGNSLLAASCGVPHGKLACA